MNIMEIDGHENSRQPVSPPSPHVVDVKRQFTYDYIIYLFLFHINNYSYHVAVLIIWQRNLSFR